MNKDSGLNIIKIKERKIKFLKVIDLFLRIVFTLIGTFSLVSILMFLNSRFGVSYFSCLVVTLIAPSIYSFFVNLLLDGMGNKIKRMEFEIKRLEDQYKEDNRLRKDSIIKNIEIRFEGLSNDRKKELLNYIKDRIPQGSCYEYISKLEDSDVLSLICDDDLVDVSEKEKGYSRKRNISDEIRR